MLNRKISRKKGRNHRTLVYIFLMLGLTFWCQQHFTGNAAAASATVSLSASKNNPEKGEEFYVVIKIESSAEIGEVEMYLNYDTKALKFITGGTIATKENKLIHLKDTISDDSQVKKYSLSFTARKKGETVLSLLTPLTVMDASEGTKMSASSNQLSIYVAGSEVTTGQEEEELFHEESPETGETGEGTDNFENEESGAWENMDNEPGEPVVYDHKGGRLKRLSISPQLLAPEFNKKVYVYTTTVAYEVTSLIISYETIKEDSLVEITGNENFQVGENLVKIKVIGQDGYTKTYKIKVTRKEQEKEEIPLEESQSVTEKEGDESQIIHQKESRVYEEKQYQSEILQWKLLVGILVTFIFLLLAFIVWLVLKNREKNLSSATDQETGQEDEDIF